MFINRLKDSIKKITEPLLWLSGALVLILLLDYSELFRNVVFWIGAPLVVIIQVGLIGLVFAAWIQWQFVEPYKSYKANKNK